MTTKAVEEIIEKATTDTIFRKQLASNPDQALSPFQDKLTAEELSALKSITPALLEGTAGLISSTADKEPPAPPWYQPSSFKEAGGALLSIILIIMLFVVANRVFQQIDSPPFTVAVGDSQQLVDPFDRAKDLLNILFPLVSAVITFWLGVAVEGKRAEANAETAKQERKGRHKAEQREGRAKSTFKSTLARAEGIAISAGKTPRRGALEGIDQPDEPMMAILDVLRSGQQALD